MHSFVDASSVEYHRGSRELVVLLHAYTSSPERLHYVRDIVINKRPDADIFTPSLPASTFSMADPVVIAGQLLKDLDTLWNERLKQSNQQAYERITLIGHSLGALLARKIYVYACGGTDEVPFEDAVAAAEPRVWASKVERIILLAGMNRGWSISPHMTPINAIGWRLGSFAGEVIWLFKRQRLLILTIRRGAPFITQLRLQWLAMQQHAAAKHLHTPITIQLLGTVDDLVSPDDNIDLVTGAKFIYLDVPGAGHGTIIDMDASPDKGRKRSAVFTDALQKSEHELKQMMVEPADSMPSPANLKVTDVIFVIHGIRDLGFWTNKLARRIKAKMLEHDKGRVIVIETSTYGYFAMLPFILPSQRHTKVEWLMDQYTEDKALYPKANFSFVGHSNGTYLLARALQDYPSCRFKRVVFGNSVVDWHYDWAKAVHNRQVQQILNYVATGDWVVACFPKALQTLHIEDLGSAGHNGFVPVLTSEAQELPLQQVRYISGSHGASVEEANWDAITEFIVDGVVHSPTTLPKQQIPWVVWAGRLAPLIWVVLLCIACGIGYGIVSLGVPEWVRTVLLIGYLWLLWKVLTHV